MTANQPFVAILGRLAGSYRAVVVLVSPDDHREDEQSERDVGCAFWAAALAGGLFLLLAGYGFAALSDGLSRVLLDLLGAMR